MCNYKNIMQLTLFSDTKHHQEKATSRIPATALNSAQMEAVQTVSGPVLVIAGAGSGKTRTLVYRLVHLVEEGVSPENILLLTFTRKAAQEMISRAVTLLDDSCQRVMGGTFHAVANLLLRRYAGHIGYQANFTILDRGDAEGIVNLIKSSLDLGGAGKRFPSKRVILTILSGAVNKSLTIDDLVAAHYSHLLEFLPDLLRIRDHYQLYKRDHGLMDYDDLLVCFRDLLALHEEVRQEIAARFRYIMVDEYQDTNHIQAEIVRLLATGHDNVMAVGDDSQSIYSFRGADFRNIMDFPKIFPGTRLIRLEENYRSCEKILAATNAIIEQAREKYSKKLFSSIRGGDHPTLFTARDEGDQARYVTGMILDLHSKGLPFHEMAVLFRSGYHSFKLELELANHRIPFEKRGGLKLTETAHVKDILSYLRLAANPDDALSWSRILLHLPKVGPKTVQKIVEALRTADDHRAVLRSFKAAPGWRDDFREMVEMYEDLATSASPAGQLERIMVYYLPIFERLYHDDFPSRARDLEQLKTIIADYDNLQSFLDDTALDPPELSEVGPLPTTDTLVLSTVHSAKGLEWDTVFVINLADGKFPTSHAALFPEQYEEERRLLYVAATRAKSRLFFCYPRETVAPDRSRHIATLSPFLAELPPGLVRSGIGGSNLLFPRTLRTEIAVGGETGQKTVEPPVASGETIASETIASTRDLRVGMQVRHGFFGTGEVKSLAGDKTVDVFFPRYGRKTLRLDYAKLEFA